MTKDLTDTPMSTAENSGAARKAPGTPRETKTAQLRRLLSRKTGATLPTLQKATGWQAHSVRAAMSGLRKTGYTVARTDPGKPGGDSVYRITAQPDGSA